MFSLCFPRDSFSDTSHFRVVDFRLPCKFYGLLLREISNGSHFISCSPFLAKPFYILEIFISIVTCKIGIETPENELSEVSHNSDVLLAVSQGHDGIESP